MSGRNFGRQLLVALALGYAACGDSSTTAPSTPPTPITETFSGTLTVNGGVTHPFTSQTSGTVTATLTTVEPDSAAVIGLSLGTWNGAGCQVVLARDQATQGASLIGTVSAAGSLCVRVYDVGALTESVNYVIDVSHP